MATFWVTPVLTAVFIRPTLDLRASYCTVSFFPITPHQQCSVLLPDRIPFFLSFRLSPFRCQHLYTIPVLQILQLDGWTSTAHSSSLLSPALTAVFTSSCSQLDKWCPSLFFSLFSLPSPSPHPLSISLSVIFHSPPCTTTGTSAAPSSLAVKAL